MTTPADFEKREPMDMSPSRIFDLTGRTAVLTGAAGGIGRWLAAGLAASGASVALVDVDDSGINQLRKELGSFDVACSTHPAHLRTADGDELLADVLRQHESIDILVNCAAVNHRKPIMDVD